MGKFRIGKYIKENEKVREYAERAILALVYIIVTILITNYFNTHKDKSPHVALENETSMDSTLPLGYFIDGAQKLPIQTENEFKLLSVLDNRSSGYIKGIKFELVVDDFKKVLMKDFILLRLQHTEGDIPTVPAAVDLSSIGTAINNRYKIQLYNEHNGEYNEVVPNTIMVEGNTAENYCIYITLQESGIYSIHLEYTYDYFGKEHVVRTSPYTFAYWAGDLKDYKYTDVKDRSKYIVGTEQDFLYRPYHQMLYYVYGDGRCVVYNTQNANEPQRMGGTPFLDYYSLIKSIEFEEGTTEISFSCFNTLRNLEEIYFPSTLQKIYNPYDSKTSFGERYNNLTDIYYNGTLEEWNNIVIEEQNENFYNAVVHTID